MALHHLLVRSVHVLGMALLVGGSVAAWAGLRWTLGDARRIAAGYEWLFWSVIGVMVATGVGNLGAMAPAVPGPETAWGTTLSAKLGALAGLLVASGARVLLVAEGGAGGTAGPEEAAVDAGTGSADGSGVVEERRRGDGLRRAYAATAWYLVGLLALAEVLAHG